MKVAQSRPTLCNPTDCTVHGILQARILEWVAYSFSRGSSRPRNQTGVSCIAGGFFTNWAREPLVMKWDSQMVVQRRSDVNGVEFLEPPNLCKGIITLGRVQFFWVSPLMVVLCLSSNWEYFLLGACVLVGLTSGKERAQQHAPARRWEGRRKGWWPPSVCLGQPPRQPPLLSLVSSHWLPVRGTAAGAGFLPQWAFHSLF